MTRVEIVEAAIEHLNRVKNTNLKILSCYIGDTGTVLVKVAYPKVIPGWSPHRQSYKFNHSIEVEYGILQKDCEKILKDFFLYLRKKKKIKSEEK